MAYNEKPSGIDGGATQSDLWCIYFDGLREGADKLREENRTLRDGITAAIRAVNLALFVIRKHGVMPNSSWESGLISDIALAQAALSTHASVADGANRYLIIKNGMYYRPNAQGYTSNVAEAGRYTLAEAISHSHPNGPDGPRDGMSYRLDITPTQTSAEDAPDAADQLYPCEACGTVICHGDEHAIYADGVSVCAECDKAGNI